MVEIRAAIAGHSMSCRVVWCSPDIVTDVGFFIFSSMRKLFTLLIFILLPLSLWAQMTTSSIAGTVTDNGSSPLIGATVVATHTPTATNYATATDIDGKYHLDGLKPGGEYIVMFSFVGYKGASIDKIYTSIGETLQLNATLKEQDAIDCIVVTSEPMQGDFSKYDMEAMPTVSRSIYDIARLSPYANSQQEGGVAIGGANSRYNSFYIDGIVNNDMYGLTSSGTNGGLAGANPIPLDALDRIQIVTARFYWGWYQRYNQIGNKYIYRYCISLPHKQPPLR